MDFTDVSFVLKGRKRKDLLLALDRPRTPTQISKVIDVSVTNLWSKLKALERQGLVECLTPEEQKGRIYALTKKGDSVRKKVQQMDVTT
ncbi:helix-turn-helix domain-containing protein [Candidatus Micrarchaeota archaeon]|nr:helix-turn-helix domain-containing protein [Candidatus Micrarchaeota archaeon]